MHREEGLCVWCVPYRWFESLALLEVWEWGGCGVVCGIGQAVLVPLPPTTQLMHTHLHT